MSINYKIIRYSMLWSFLIIKLSMPIEILDYLVFLVSENS